MSVSVTVNETTRAVALTVSNERGPIGADGIDGQDGIDGSDATVTAENVALIINDALAADPEGAAAAGDLQSTTIGFLDRFDYGTRYAENATLTNDSSLPEVGGVTYKIATNGATRPKIVSGALEAVSDSLDYFANQVTTTGGKFNLGLVVDFKRSSVYTTAVNNGAFTIAVSEQPLVVAGSIGGISATNPIHVTIRPDGISDAGFYLGSQFTCLNATYAGGVFPWTSRSTQLPYGEKMAILFRVKGDILEVEAVGVGTLYFYHADISTKIGATTYFFYEPVGPDYGTDYRHTARLYRWWVNADEYDQIAGYGVTVPECSGGPHRFPGQVQLFPNGMTSGQSANTLAGQTTAAVRGGSVSSSAKGAYSRATGGHVQFEGVVSHEYGHINAGASMQGFMVGSIDSNLNTAVSSTAGALNNPNVGNTLWAHGLENGDWEHVFLAGTLVGAGAKKIRIMTDSATYGAANVRVLADSNATGTPINGVTGFWTAEIWRYTNSGSGMLFYCELKANGTLLNATRQVLSLRDALVYYGVECTTADAGGVVIDTHIRKIARVNPL